MKTPDFAAAYRIQGPDRPGSEGPTIAEYCSEPATSPFPSPTQSMRLPVEETPETTWDEPSKWASVDDFGADPTGQKDSAAAVQKAMDSGAATIFLPGSYILRSPVTIGGKVRRVVGLGGTINYGEGLHPDLRLVDGEAPVVFLEHFAHIHGGLEIATPRTVVLRSVSDCVVTIRRRRKAAHLFFEDVVTHGLKLGKQHLWARQLNIENEGTHFANDGGNVGCSATRPNVAARWSTHGVGAERNFRRFQLHHDGGQARPDVRERRCLGLRLLRRGLLLGRPVCRPSVRGGRGKLAWSRRATASPYRMPGIRQNHENIFSRQHKN